MDTNSGKLLQLIRAKFGSVKQSNGHNGTEYIVKCPVCGKRKLTINAKSGIYKCWRGCMSGSIGSLAGIPVSAARRQAPTVREFDSPGVLVPLTQLDDANPAILYLRARGFDPKELDTVYGMRYCVEGKKYAHGLFNTTNTIIVPAFVDGKVVGWQSRLLYNPDKLTPADCEVMGFIKDEDGDFVKPPKYFTMPGMQKGSMLWNHDLARQSKVVVVCEGIFDAMAVGRCAVATFGKSVTDDQVDILKAYWDLVIILLDPGDADDDMQKLSNKLSSTSIIVQLKGYKDAGEAPRAEIWRQIDAAVSGNPVLKAAGRTLADYNFIV